MLRFWCKCFSFRRRVTLKHILALILISLLNTFIIFEENYSKELKASLKSSYDILNEMNMKYPTYFWTHTGWNMFYKTLGTNYKAKINVHVVPFSHNDAGWLNTPNEYFYHTSSKILDTVLDQLKANPSYTFVWSEVWFIKKWYNNLQNEDQSFFKKLIKEKRFEILTGSMIEVDEATSHYMGILDQLHEGRKWLHSTFDITIDSAWSLDSFGHSSALTYILYHSGIEYLYIQRTHYAMKEYLNLKKEGEFLWLNENDEIISLFDNNYKKSSVFTHMSPAMSYAISYACGPNYEICCQFDFNKNKCWNKGVYSAVETINDDNIHQKASLLAEQIRKKHSLFRHDHVLHLVGDDFTFSNSYEWKNQFENLDKLFNYINKNNFNLNIQYSTIGNYLKAAKKSIKSSQMPSLKGDFYPYSDRGKDYWSGLYTTRPHLKLLIRKCSFYLRNVDLLLVYSYLKAGSHNEDKSFLHEIENKLVDLRDQLSIYNHHDTITGTSRIHVINALYEQISQNLDILHQTIVSLISYLRFNLKTHYFLSLVDLNPVLSYQNEHVIQDLKLPKTYMFFNPMANSRTFLVKLYLKKREKNIFVSKFFKSKKVFAKCQVEKSPLNGKQVKYEVSFFVDIQAFSFLYVNVSSEETESSFECQNVVSKIRKLRSLNDNAQNEHFDLNNKYFHIPFSFLSNSIQHIFLKNSNTNLKFGLRFSNYITGSFFKPFFDKSGAYIFLPFTDAQTIPHHSLNLTLNEGQVKSSLTLEYSSNFSQTITITHTENIIAKEILLETFVDIRNERNYEIALEVNVDSPNSFYTDANGLQMVKRKYRQKLTTQGNFYAITNLMYIHQSPSLRLNLLTSSTHGVTLKRSKMEVMLDRKLEQDDWRGLSQGVTDNKPLNSQFIIIPEEQEGIGSNPNKELFATPYVTKKSISIENPLIAFELAFEHTTSQKLPINLLSTDHSSSFIHSSLPPNISLVSLKLLSKSQTHIDIVVFLQNTDTTNQIVAQEIDIHILFPDQKIMNVYESDFAGALKGHLVESKVKIFSSQLKSFIIEISVI